MQLASEPQQPAPSTCQPRACVCAMLDASALGCPASTAWCRQCSVAPQGSVARNGCSCGGGRGWQSRPQRQGRLDFIRVPQVEGCRRAGVERASRRPPPLPSKATAGPLQGYIWPHLLQRIVAGKRQQLQRQGGLLVVWHQHIAAPLLPGVGRHGCRRPDGAIWCSAAGHKPHIFGPRSREQHAFNGAGSAIRNSHRSPMSSSKLARPWAGASPRPLTHRGSGPLAPPAAAPVRPRQAPPACGQRHCRRRTPWGPAAAVPAAAAAAAAAGHAPAAAAAVLAAQPALGLVAVLDEAPEWTLDQAVGLVFGGLLVLLYLSSTQASRGG